MSVQNVQNKEVVGSSFQEKLDHSRLQLVLNLNQTASVVPLPFLARRRVEEEGKENSAWVGRTVEQLLACPRIDLENEAAEVEKLIEPISAHCEMRIQLYYQMLCLVFDSKYVFSHQSAQAQAGTKGGGSDGLLAEAHCSTFASLLCWSGAENEAAFDENPADISPVEFARRSFYFHSWNMTMKLPFVNKVDSQIDFQTKFRFLGNKTFRECCNVILNLVSEGKKTPQQGLSLFLARFIQVVKFLNPSNNAPVLNCYLSVAEFYSGFIQSPANLALLTFERGPQLPYKEIQKTMWREMTKEVRAYQLFDRIHEFAVKTFGLDGIHSKECLVPGILLRLYPGSSALELPMNQLQGSLPTELQHYYARRLAYDIHIVKLTRTYFESFDSVQSLSEALTRQIGAGEFYRKFTLQAKVCLNKNVQHINKIFLLAMPMIYSYLNPTEESLAIRRFLNIGDRWFSVLVNSSSTKDIPAIQRHIAQCAQHPAIIDLAKELVQVLKNAPLPKEEKKDD